MAKDNRVPISVGMSLDNCTVALGYLQVTQFHMCRLLAVGQMEMTLYGSVFTAPGLILDLGQDLRHQTSRKYNSPSFYSG